MSEIDTAKVGVSGYSRYGKAAAVAGAFDDRIAATFPGSSGTAGMGNYRFFSSSTASENETLDDILGAQRVERAPDIGRRADDHQPLERSQHRHERGDHRPECRLQRRAGG